MSQETEPYSRKDERVAAARQLIQQGFESLVAELQAGHTERYLEYLAFLSRFHRYSHLNQMLIFMQMPEATLVAGYRKWQEMGCQVRKGERGIAIFAPLIGRVKKTIETGEEIEVERLFGFKTVTVFDASQLVQPPEALFPALPDDAQEQYELVRRAVTLSHIGVLETGLPRGVYGQSKGNVIYLQEGLDSRRRTSVLIREWGHEILHRQWMDIKDAIVQIPKPVRELQVESVSYIVSRYLGIDNPFSRDYLLQYGNTAEDLMTNMELIQRASHHMIEKIEGILQKG